MTAPPFLVGAGLLFWGRQSGLLPLAVPLALLLEAHRAVSRRWELTRAQYQRVSDLCTLIFFGIAVFLYASRQSLPALMTLVQWLPVILLPIALAQAYSALGAVDASVFYWSWKKRLGESGPLKPVDASHGYLAVCVFAAAAANRRDGTFFAGMLALAVWALWGARRPGASRAVWALLLAAAAFLGWRGQAAVAASQGFVERIGAEVALGLAWVGRSPYEARTAIGSIGAVKGYDTILLRLRPAAGEPPPALLRGAAYDSYRAGTWQAHDSAFVDVPRGATAGAWTLASAPPRERALELSAPLKASRGVLPLPAGTFAVEGLPAQSVRVSRLGTVQALEGPRTAALSVRFDPGSRLESGPGPGDLEVPKTLRAPFAALAAQLGLDAARPEEALAAAARHFETGFAYSIYQDGVFSREDPLVRFLNTTRKGHCEYFGTAAVLLLRAAGIPARYATGYAVLEYSRLEGAYIVRQRHAHAWAQAYVKGTWRDFDVTPDGWLAAEEERASAWQPLRDAWAWATHGLGRAWRFAVGADWRRRGPLALIPLLAFLAWRIGSTLSAARRKSRESAGPADARRGLDSEFYAVEARLREDGLGRRPWEANAAWLERLSAVPGWAERAAGLRALAALHERHRFDPRGLSPEERARLREGSIGWVAGPKAP